MGRQIDLLEIAQDIVDAKLKKQIADLEIWRLQQDLETLRIHATPLNGFEGKNAEMRKIAEEKFWAQNDEFQTITAAIRKHTETSLLMGAAIDVARSKRRGLEWAVRLQFIEGIVETPSLAPDDELENMADVTAPLDAEMAMPGDLASIVDEFEINPENPPNQAELDGIPF